MTAHASVVLGDNPSNDEILDTLETLAVGGTLSSDLADDEGNAWACTIVRFFNHLGPDPSDRFGSMRYQRISTAEASSRV